MSQTERRDIEHAVSRLELEASFYRTHGGPGDHALADRNLRAARVLRALLGEEA